MLSIFLGESLIGFMQLLLLIITFAVIIIFIIQFFRWLYGILFVPKFRISFFKVIIPFFLSVFLFLFIGYVDYLIKDVWQLSLYK